MCIYFNCILELVSIKLNTLTAMNSVIQVQAFSYHVFYGSLFKKCTSKS